MKIGKGLKGLPFVSNPSLSNVENENCMKMPLYLSYSLLSFLENVVTQLCAPEHHTGKIHSFIEVVTLFDN